MGETNLIVEEDDAEERFFWRSFASYNLFDGDGAILCRIDDAAEALEEACHELASEGVVIDYEDVELYHSELWVSSAF